MRAAGEDPRPYDVTMAADGAPLSWCTLLGLLLLLLLLYHLLLYQKCQNLRISSHLVELIEGIKVVEFDILF